jgi:hypothetical protein
MLEVSYEKKLETDNDMLRNTVENLHDTINEKNQELNLEKIDIHYTASFAFTNPYNDNLYSHMIYSGSCLLYTSPSPRDH